MSLVPFVHNSSSKTTNSNNSVLLPELDFESGNSTFRSSDSHPVFALSNRLLAYASPPPRADSSTSIMDRQPRTRSPTGTGSLGFGMTQTELGSTALKVGGNVLSGMKTLGGLAYSAAKARAGLAEPGATPKGASIPSMGALTNRFFSRSAPAAGAHERCYSTTSMSGNNVDNSTGLSLPDHASPVIPRTTSPSKSETGYYITILDLAPLTKLSRPITIAEFRASKHQPISDLRFSSDGNAILVSPKDGQVVQVFQVRPTPLTSRTVHDIAIGGAQDNVPSKVKSPVVPQSRNLNSIGQASPWHIYDLRRGRTSAVVEGLDWALDGRWLAVGTRKRTIHIFAVNPYGGEPDQRSHLEGRVRNFIELVSIVFQCVLFHCDEI